jgi:hypothetical protein
LFITSCSFRYISWNTLRVAFSVPGTASAAVHWFIWWWRSNRFKLKCFIWSGTFQ